MTSPNLPKEEIRRLQRVGYQLARRAGLSEEDSEEVGSDALERFLAASAGDVEILNPAAWVTTAANRKIIDALRRRNSRPESAGGRPGIPVPDGRPTPENQAIDHIMIDQLHKIASRRLSPNELRAFESLWANGGVVGDAIACVSSMSGCSPQQIRTELMRACEKLRKSASEWEENPREES